PRRRAAALVFEAPSSTLQAIRYQVRPDELDYARVVVAISERSGGSRPAILRSRMRSASKRSLISGSFAIWTRRVAIESSCARNFALVKGIRRSEEHTSELQS